MQKTLKILLLTLLGIFLVGGFVHARKLIYEGEWGYYSLSPSNLTTPKAVHIFGMDNLQYSSGGQVNIDGVQYENFNPNQGTLEFWVRPNWDGDDNLQHHIFDNRSDANNQIQLYKNTSNNLILEVKGNGTSRIASVSVSAWTTETQYYVVAVWDRNNIVATNEYLRVYWNNTNVSSNGTSAPSALTSIASTFQIGEDYNATNQFNGTIGGRILNRPLTSTEVSALYNNGAGSTDTFTVTPDTIWMSDYSDSTTTAVYQHQGKTVSSIALGTTESTLITATGADSSFKDNDRVVVSDGIGYKKEGLIDGTPFSTSLNVDDNNLQLIKSREQQVKVGYYYYGQSNGTANWGINTGTREAITVGHRYRVRQSGTLTRADFYVASSATITEFYITAWRKDGDTYDRIGITENIASRLVGGKFCHVTFDSPITGVIEGDYIGYRIVTNGDENQLYARNLGVANVNTYYVDAVATTSGYDWEAQSVNSGYAVTMDLYMEDSPVFVIIGDSIMSGRPYHEPPVNDLDLWSPTTTIAYHLWSKNSTFTYQNIGWGGQTTTAISARFAADVIDLKPRIAIINGGINDVNQSLSQATFIANWTSMLDACVSASIIPVVILMTPWSGGTTEQMQTRDAWNTALSSLISSSYPTAIVIDANSAIGQFRVGGDAGNLWDLQAIYSADGIHLTEAGNEVIATLIYDQIGNINTYNSIPNLDKIGVNVNFNGLYSAYGGVINNVGSDDFSISVWTKFTDKNNIWLLGNGVTSNYTGYAIYYMSSGNKIYAGVRKTATKTCNTTTNYADGKWHHLAVTFDRDGVCIIYVDGIQNGTMTAISSEAGDIASTRIWALGNADSGGANVAWNGAVADVKFYRGGLWTIAQIRYQTQHPFDYSASAGSLTEYYPCNEGSGTTIRAGVVSTGNDLILSNALAWNQSAFVSKNLIADSGMENGGIGGWIQGDIASVLAKSTNVVKFDAHSLKITNADTTQAFTRQTITTEANENYRFHGWFRTPTMPNGASQLVDVDGDALKGITVTQAGATGSNSWYEVDFTFQAGDDSTDIDLGSGSITNTEAGYWDNVMVINVNNQIDAITASMAIKGDGHYPKNNPYFLTTQ